MPMSVKILHCIHKNLWWHDTFSYIIFRSPENSFYSNPVLSIFEVVTVQFLFSTLWLFLLSRQNMYNLPIYVFAMSFIPWKGTFLVFKRTHSTITSPTGNTQKPITAFLPMYFNLPFKIVVYTTHTEDGVHHLTPSTSTTPHTHTRKTHKDIPSQVNPRKKTKRDRKEHLFVYALTSIQV